MKKGVLLLVALVCGLLAKLSYASPSSEDGMITAFILPHSHDDVGWLLTISDYYNTFVRNIYDQVIEALSSNPARKFIVVEQAYFTIWWTQTATDQQKQQTHQLVKNGQLEFIIGGWTMEDEACTTYGANIDQMTLGHKFIKETFGVVPRFGWQIDPFGASTVVHEQYALMGFDATVIDRIPEKWKSAYKHNQTMEFVWRPSASRGDQLEIFTHVMYEGYCYPLDELTWEWGATAVNPLNIEDIANDMVNEIKKRHKAYRTQNVLFPFGCDFAHWWSTWMFWNMDQMVEYINARSSTYGVKVQYATLSDYFDAVHAANLTWPVRGPEDFLPYNDESLQYWSGFYTSRNALKGWVRGRESVLRTAETLHALSLPPWGCCRNASSLEKDLQRLHSLRAANGEATHHDAVTGTSEYWVVAMYDEHERKGSENVDPVVTQALASLCTTSNNNNNTPQLTLDVSVVHKILDSGKQAGVVIYNTLAWDVKGVYVSVL